MKEKTEIILSKKSDGSVIKIPVYISDEIPENEIYIYDAHKNVYKVIGLLKD